MDSGMKKMIKWVGPIAILGVCFSSVGTEAAAMYKCKDKWGKPSFSDKPCGKDAEEVTVKQPTTYGYEDKSGDWESVKRANREREIERQIDARQKKIKNYKRAMNKKLAKLSHKKKFAANNLAGANWEVSISEEMKAVTDKYNSLIEYEKSEIENLRKQLVA